MIHLTYPEAEYPGWEAGDEVQGPLLGPDGEEYLFEGTVKVGGVVFNAGRDYDVQLVYVPMGHDPHQG